MRLQGGGQRGNHGFPRVKRSRSSPSAPSLRFRPTANKLPDVPATVEQLQRVPLFSDMDKKELQSLASSFKERRFSKGDTVAAEGTGGIGFFVIDEGEAKITLRGDETARLKAGDYFGEIALIDEGARTATITADTDMVCYGLTSWEFRPLVESNSSIAWKLVQALAKQLREARSG
jgi:CRP/FNR family transcriptional regulator, cyclic AMP receptor protein